MVSIDGLISVIACKGFMVGLLKNPMEKQVNGESLLLAA